MPQGRALNQKIRPSTARGVRPPPRVGANGNLANRVADQGCAAAEHTSTLSEPHRAPAREGGPADVSSNGFGGKNGSYRWRADGAPPVPPNGDTFGAAPDASSHLRFALPAAELRAGTAHDTSGLAAIAARLRTGRAIGG